jgi:AraC-like DNA-binding protein
MEAMPSCDVRTFTDLDEFAAAIQGTEADLSVAARGTFAAGITRIDLGSLRLQRLSENLPIVTHLSNAGGRASFIFHTAPGPGLIRNGHEENSESMIRVGTPQSHFQRSSGPVRWGTISLPFGDIPPLSQAMGADLTPPRGDRIVKPRPQALANLQRLHAAAELIVKDAPELLANPEGARGIEQILMQALVACLNANDNHVPTSTHHRHLRVIQRFHAILEANPGQAIYVLEMAAAIGTSMRSLHVCCQEHLGMGPKASLILRRMNLARNALSTADPSMSNVTDVATQYGFWQFGRFAGEYKSLFGESPSVTLRRLRPGS